MTISQSALETVELALKLDGLSDYWRIRMEPEAVAEFLRRAPSYNRMKSMDSLVADINEIMPAFKRSNGEEMWVHNILVGNESSRVVYVEMPKLGFATDWHRVAVDIQSVGFNHGADSAYIDIQNKSVRLWWD